MRSDRLTSRARKPARPVCAEGRLLFVLSGQDTGHQRLRAEIEKAVCAVLNTFRDLRDASEAIEPIFERQIRVPQHGNQCFQRLALAGKGARDVLLLFGKKLPGGNFGAAQFEG